MLKLHYCKLINSLDVGGDCYFHFPLKPIIVLWPKVTRVHNSETNHSNYMVRNDHHQIRKVTDAHVNCTMQSLQLATCLHAVVLLPIPVLPSLYTVLLEYFAGEKTFANKPNQQKI